MIAIDRPIPKLSVVAGLLVLCAGLLAPSPGRAQSLDGVIPITSEPHHKIRFDNGRVRLVEAVIAKGKASLFHTHLHDAFFVFFCATEVGNHLLGEKPVVVKVTPGTAHFTSTAKGPYAHSVIAAGQETVHVSALELMERPAAGAPSAPQDRFPPFEVAVDNPRGRLYRLKLGPGEATEAFARPARTAILAVTSGRVSEMLEGEPARLWDFEPGSFRWIEAGEELTIRNEGTSPIHLAGR